MDFAAYHAGRILRDHGPGPLRWDALHAACVERGVRVAVDAGLKAGAYVGPPHCLIGVRARDPWALAHELGHHLAQTADPEVLESFLPVDEERLCDAFAVILCGPKPQPEDDCLPIPSPLSSDDVLPPISPANAWKHHPEEAALVRLLDRWSEEARAEREWRRYNR